MERGTDVKSRLIVCTLLALLLTGCLGGSGQQGTAEVGVYMVQTEPAAYELQAQAGEGIAAVWVNVAKVTARVDGRWVTLVELPEGEGSVNLSDLRYRGRLLGSKTIPAGKIDELRFVLRENKTQGHLYNYVILADGSKVPLKVPSNELKPQLNLSVTKDSVVELVFGVNLAYFVEKGSDGSYNANPSKALRFLESYLENFASIRGEIVLPAGVDQLLAIELHLWRTGYPHPIWTAHLQDGVLRFEITNLLEGEYRLEASLQLLGTASITLSSGPFYLEAGSSKALTLGSKGK